MSLYRLAVRRPEPPNGQDRPHAALLIGIGTVAGFFGGVLGLGGGVLMVPLLQLVARVPLREAIGTSAAVMVLTSVVGAALKTATLPSHDAAITDGLALALAMAPGAIVGSLLGSALTHSLPIHAVRGAITLLLLASAAKLAGLF